MTNPVEYRNQLAWRLENPRTMRMLEAAALEAAAIIRQPPADLIPTRFATVGGATIELTRTNPDGWAVRNGAERMSITGEWSIEPQPSSRSVDWLFMHTFISPQTAWEALEEWRGANGEQQS